MITHCQLVSSFASFKIAWPKQFQEAMRTLSAVFSFKLDFIAHPECSARITHLEKWSLFLAVPFVFASMYGMYFCYRWLCCWSPVGFVYRKWKSGWTQGLCLVLILLAADRVAFAASAAD